MKLTLEQMRLFRGKTIKDMAEMMHVSISAYRGWEKTPSKVQLGNLLHILDILAFSIDDLNLFNDKEEHAEMLDF